MEPGVGLVFSAVNESLSAFANCSDSSTSGLFGNSSVNGTCTGQEDGPRSIYPLLVLEFAKFLYGIVCIVGLLGNTLVIYVVLRFSKMQTVTNMYIFNLAVSGRRPFSLI